MHTWATRARAVGVHTNGDKCAMNDMHVIWKCTPPAAAALQEGVNRRFCRYHDLCQHAWGEWPCRESRHSAWLFASCWWKGAAPGAGPISTISRVRRIRKILLSDRTHMQSKILLPTAGPAVGERRGALVLLTLMVPYLLGLAVTYTITGGGCEGPCVCRLVSWLDHSSEQLPAFPACCRRGRESGHLCRTAAHCWGQQRPSAGAARPRMDRAVQRC